jgi:hypothetical protein
VVYSLDGRELRLDTSIPFYALNSSPAPYVESFFPSDGASAAVGENGGPFLSLRFSRPMDRLSTETAFTLEGLGEKIFAWEDDDRLLVISSGKPLSPWTAYRWTLGSRAQSRDGVPIAETAGGRFITDLDRELPGVIRVFPMIPSGGGWFFSGGSIGEDLGSGQGIGIEFSKPMGENVFHSIRFEPSLPGRTERLSPSSFLFIPARDPEPETIYTLTVSGDAQDTTGLKMGADYAVCFKADIPFLRLLSFTADKAEPFTDFPSGPSASPLAGVPVNPADGVLRFSIHFSLSISDEAKRDIPLRISLAPWFPPDLKQKPVSLRYVEWSSDYHLRMEWEGFEQGEGLYYRLTLPGGKGGLNTGKGMYFREDQILYLEVIE